MYIPNKTLFSPVNYGYKKLGDLIRVCDLFEIKIKMTTLLCLSKIQKNEL